MANVCIAVTGCSVDVGGAHVSLSISDDAGHQVSTDVVVTFSASAVQINNAVGTAAKQALKDAFNVTVGVTDKVLLFGGVTLV